MGKESLSGWFGLDGCTSCNAYVTSDASDPNLVDNNATVSSIVTNLAPDYNVADSPIDFGVTGLTANYNATGDNVTLALSGIGFDEEGKRGQA